MKVISYWKFFRLIFVVFFLYLMGDAFYRWDGFKYYGSFPEFLLSIALAAVLLSIVTVMVALLIWLPYICIGRLSLCSGGQKQKKLFLFLPVFLLVSAAAWSAKRFMFPLLETSPGTKILVLFCVLVASAFTAWLLRDRSGRWAEQIARWMEIIQTRITPLVWLFGIFVFVSAPVVIYQTWFAETARQVSEVIKRPVTGGNQPNFIFITFDAMSALDMSLYGYHRPTTPFISEWAETAAVFTRAKAASNYTAPTTSSLITGKRVWTHHRFSRMRGSPPVKAGTESLAAVLKNSGYYNMAFMVNPIASVDNLGVAGSFDVAPLPTDFMIARDLVRVIHKAITPVFYSKFKIDNWFFQDGFITMRLLERLSKDFDETEYPPEMVFKQLMAAIDHGTKPFFAWVHLNPPHAPYLPPAPYKGLFDKSGGMRTIKTQLDERNGILEYQSLHKRFPSDIETLRARYDEYIRYCDDQFKGFIEQLEKEGKLNNTVIIASTDHGEIFDHNTLLHGDTLYEPETHIPLIIKGSELSAGRVVDDLVEQVDIPATILDLAGIPVPPWMEGRSLVPLMRGEALGPKPAFSMNLEESSSRDRQITKGTIAVWDGEYKMIHNLAKEEAMLFNLKNDPGELNNLIDIEPETGRRLSNLIRENLKRANERIAREN